MIIKALINGDESVMPVIPKEINSQRSEHVYKKGGTAVKFLLQNVFHIMYCCQLPYGLH